MICRADAKLGADLFDEIVVDCFAGGGGASVGIEAALGRSVDVAINHDPEAVAMHRINHPHTRHHCEDIFQIDPVEATGGRPVGLAWFSPDCKHFSKAKGGKPVSKRVRGLAWVVIKWARAVRPRVICLENVEEFTTWGPLAADGRPCPKRKGRTFRGWVGKLRELGYAVEWRELRACDYGAPTIRKRLFLIARCDGEPISWPNPTHSKDGSRGLKRWRAAASCIDWSISCPSIFERTRPLAAATLRRIAAGIMRFVVNAAEPFIVPLTHRDSGNRANSVEGPLRTITTAHRGEFALCSPTLIETGYGERKGQRPRAPGLRRPLGTVVAEGQKHALVAAFLAQHNGGVVGHRADKPISTLVSRCTQQQVVAATLVGCGGRAGQSRPRGLDEPAATLTAKADTCLAAAHLVKLRGTCKDGQRIDAAAPTITAGGQHAGLVCAFLAAYYGNEKDGQGVVEPIRTLTTKERFGLVTINVDGVELAIADIGMRMLVPRELYRCQGFPDGYVIDRTESGPLSKTAQVRMVGNSVSPPCAMAVVANLGLGRHSRSGSPTAVCGLTSTADAGEESMVDSAATTAT